MSSIKKDIFQKFRKPGDSRRIFFISISLFLTAFVPRFLDLGTAVIADETLWMRRSVDFMQALMSLDLSGTYQAPHPGVTTMWLGSLSMGIKYLLSGRTNISDFLFAAQLPFAIVTSLSIVAAYFMIKRIFNERIAIISGILLALDPFYLAYSRIIHLDALLTSFMTLSLLSFLIYINTSNNKFVVISGIFAGLAVLTKAPAFFLFPFAALLLFSCFFRAKITSPLSVPKLLQKLTKVYLEWIIIAFAVIFVMWPALWINPFTFIQIFTGGIEEMGMVPHENGQFFMGAPVMDPGFLFYPVLILFKTTPITLIFLAICILFLVLKFMLASNSFGKLERNTLILILYVLLFTTAITLGAKKIDRYIIPIFPIIDIIAAVGIFIALEALTNNVFKKSYSKNNDKNSNKNAFAIVVIAVFLFQLFPIIAIHPYPLSYYNPVAGGPSKARETLLIGGGVGMDLAAKYLNQKEDPQNITVASDYGFLLSVHFAGKIEPIIADKYEPNFLDKVDYLVLSVNGVQRQNLRIPQEILDYHYKHEPEYTVNINGIECVWIHKID
ncbi:MAG: glycosyltransferase family 39 protein [Candidatus Methanoperedens sp.]|nr:glycosyltransferase family 39 protein [Candidatus Methanoperedens sp.]